MCIRDSPWSSWAPVPLGPGPLGPRAPSVHHPESKDDLGPSKDEASLLRHKYGECSEMHEDWSASQQSCPKDHGWLQRDKSRRVVKPNLHQVATQRGLLSGRPSSILCVWATGVLDCFGEGLAAPTTLPANFANNL